MSLVDELRSGVTSVDTFLATQRESDITERMMGRLPQDLDKSEGSYLWDSVVPSSMEFEQAYIALQHLIRLAFPQTSYGEYLAKKAAAHGIERKNAVRATGYLTITGTAGVKIPLGSKFSTTIPAGSSEKVRYYSTLEEKAISADGTGVIRIEADESGSIGNVKAGSINSNVSSISGITSVYNPGDINSGIDEESDTELLQRFLSTVRKPSFAGNVNDYRKWAQEVKGVGEAVPISLWNGPGTVKVIVLDPGGQPVSPEIIQAVKSYIDPTNGYGDGMAPIGANVTVVTAAKRFIDVTIPGLELASGYAQDTLKSAIADSLSYYFLTISLGGMVRIKEAESIINNVPGVLDFRDILFNGTNLNIQLGSEEKATLGQVIYS